MKRVFLALSFAVMAFVGFDCPWLPDPPTPVSPSDGSVGVSTEPMLQWNVTSSATSYRLQVSGLSNSTSYYWRVLATNSYGKSDWSTVSLFTTIIFDKKGITGTFYPDSGLTVGTRYYWRVSASNAGGTSNWSRAWSFIVGGL